MRILFGLLLFCSIVILGVLYALFQRFVSEYPEDRICGNIFIGAADVSGLTKKEAQKLMTEFLNEGRQATLTLKVGDSGEEIALEELGLGFKDIKRQVKTAYDYGKSGSLWKRFWQLKELSKEKKVIDENYILDQKKLKAFIEEKIDPLVDHAQNATMKRDGSEFKITKEKQGETVDVDQTLSAVTQYLNSGWNRKNVILEAVQREEAPTVTAEDLKTVTDELGSYSTDAGSGERWQNLKTGVEKINGIVLAPGEEISIHDVTAPYDEEHGYVAAGSYENGQVVDTYGGGICQVSTTLYNAVLFAELEVTERYPHSMLVTYVDPSRDAAIAGDVKDFCFRNNYSTPIFIEGGIDDDNQLKFTIYGRDTREEGRTVEYESEVTSTEEYGRQYKEDSEAALGSMEYEGSPHTGKTAKLWKIVKQDGKEVSREEINESYYQKSDEIIVVGTASDNPKASGLVSSAIASQDGSKINAAISEARELE